MTTNIFLINSIIEISKEKLLYINNENKIQEIDFQECRINWVEHFNKNSFIALDGNPAPKTTLKENGCVGERDWYAERPYYEFYSNPKIKFEIRIHKRAIDYFLKNWRQKYYKEFSDIDDRLHKVGLSTFDLG